VAGQGVVGVAVDEETDGGDLGERGVEGADDRLDGEGFYLDAGGVIVDEAAAKVDDSQVAGLCVAAAGVRLGVGQEEDFVDGWAALERMGRVGESVGGEEVLEEGAGAEGGGLGKGERFGGWRGRG
jgi:hypothetical protein